MGYVLSHQFVNAVVYQTVVEILIENHFKIIVFLALLAQVRIDRVIPRFVYSKSKANENKYSFKL